MDKEEIFDKIEAYLIGQMTETERLAFEQEIAKDEDLAKDVAFQRLEYKAIDALVKNDLRRKMAQWQKDIPIADLDTAIAPLVVVAKKDAPTTPKKIVFLSSSFMRYAAAASAILGVVLIGLWLNKPIPENSIVDTNPKSDTIKTTPTPSDIKPKEEVVQTPTPPIDKAKPKIQNPKPTTSTYPELPPQYNDLLAYAETTIDEQAFESNRDNKGENRGENTNKEDKMALVAEAYKAERYTEALGILQKLPINDSVSEALGLVYFKLKAYDKAVSYFQPLLNDAFLKERTQWNLVACYAAQYPAKATELNQLLTLILGDKEHIHFKDALIMKEKLGSSK